MDVYTSGPANTAESPDTSHAIIMRQIVDGAVVRKGFSPYVGANGNWYEYSDETGEFEDTGVKAQGPQGERGLQGETGQRGDKTELRYTGDTVDWKYTEDQEWQQLLDVSEIRTDVEEAIIDEAEAARDAAQGYAAAASTSATDAASSAAAAAASAETRP